MSINITQTTDIQELVKSVFKDNEVEFNLNNYICKIRKYFIKSKLSDINHYMYEIRVNGVDSVCTLQPIHADEDNLETANKLLGHKLHSLKDYLNKQTKSNMCG